MQAADNMTEGLVSLVNLSGLAWRTLSRDDTLHGTKGRLERARSTALLGQDRHAAASPDLPDRGVCAHGKPPTKVVLLVWAFSHAWVCRALRGQARAYAGKCPGASPSSMGQHISGLIMRL